MLDQKFKKKIGNEKKPPEPHGQPATGVYNPPLPLSPQKRGPRVLIMQATLAADLCVFTPRNWPRSLGICICARGKCVCVHLKYNFSRAQAQKITKQKMLHNNKILIWKVRESCNLLAYCSRGKVLMLNERVKVSINALYLYRADQVVDVLNYWAGCQHWYTFWIISNHNCVCLPYQIISEPTYDRKTEILI
jgi:hypothetical protein